jgi:regulator of nucleoside diphosphate kinase
MQPLITDMDERRLRNLLDTPVGKHSGASARLLARKLDIARIVPASAMPSTVVTMNSRFSCVNSERGSERELSLVYPWASSEAEGRISILSPLGIELLGTTPGRRLWIDGDVWSVLCLEFQPEAFHSFHL